MPKASDALMTEPAELLPDDVVVPELVLPEPLEVPVPALEELVLPSVPLDIVEGARLAVALAASAMKLSRERVALAAVFSLITNTIPFWQCSAWEQ